MLKSLHKALVSQWAERLYVPIEILNQIGLWLTWQQDPETGAFKETSDYIYDRSFSVSLSSRSMYVCICIDMYVYECQYFN